MRSHRGIRLRSWLGAAIVVVAPAFATGARAQPGFGPDPFWPYNSQYTPYVEPLGPASPDAGQGAVALPRSGLAGANRFQEYLDSVTGAGRATGTDRGGIGTPYYRSIIDPRFEQALGRVYRPNVEADRRFEQTQQFVTDKYLAYFSERDPKKRAAILRQYRRAPRRSVGELGTGRESPSRAPDATGRLFRPEGGLSPTREEDRAGALPWPRSRPGSRGAGSAGRAGAAPSHLGPLDSALGGASEPGPAPPIPSIGSSRMGGRPRRTPSPTEVLNRARALGGREGRPPDSLAPSPNRRRTDRRALPPPSLSPE